MGVLDRLDALDRRVGVPRASGREVQSPWWIIPSQIVMAVLLMMGTLLIGPSEHPYRVIALFAGVVGAWLGLWVWWFKRQRAR